MVALRRARPSCRAPARPAKLPPMMMTSSMVMGSVLWMEGVGLGLARNIVQRYALQPAFVFVCHGPSFRDSRYYNFVIDVTITSLWRACQARIGRACRFRDRGQLRSQEEAWETYQGIRRLACRSGSFRPRSGCWPSRDRPP